MLVLMIIFCFVLLAGVSIYNYCLKRAYYYDEAIYELRQSKQEILLYLGENAKKISDDDLKLLRGMLKMVNDTIGVFSKISEKRFRTIKVVIKEVIVTSRKIDNPYENELHQQLLSHYKKGFIMVIKTIPFINVRLFIKVLKIILKALAEIGIVEAKKTLKGVDQLIKAENSYSDNHCFIN